MAGGERFTNVDPATAADMRRQGSDPHKLDKSMENLLQFIYESLPDPPVSTTCRLTARRAAPSDGIDRISRLSDALLCDIVSRLPVKDAARTSVLATRWRRVWHSAPLVLIDVHLLPGGRRSGPPTRAASERVPAAVSRILAAHPGPFRCVHLVSGRMDAHQAHLAHWLYLLAAKGVQELVLVNRPWPRDVLLPASLFRMSSLTRLYIGVWKFPDAAGLRGASFPHLRELGIFNVVMKKGDIESLVARSPVLEILNIHGDMDGLRLRLVSQSLRCVQIFISIVDNVAVVNTPLLERFVLVGCVNRGAGGLCPRVKIGNAPKLRSFGYLEPETYVLEIGDTIIMPGIQPSASSMLTSVTILSLNVRFGVYNDAIMVPTFLKCFPNVSNLHIRCEKYDEPTGKLNLKFWEEVGPIISVMFRIGVFTIREFRAEEGEIAFLKYFFQNARMLRQAMIIFPNPRFSSIQREEACSKMEILTSLKWATDGCGYMVYGSSDPEGGKLWSFKDGANLSRDPFAW